MVNKYSIRRWLVCIIVVAISVVFMPGTTRLFTEAHAEEVFDKVLFISGTGKPVAPIKFKNISTETFRWKYIELRKLVCEAPEVPESEETNPVVNEDDVELLACVIYQEAGGDASCDDCRRRVADVVLNRVAHEDFPDTIYAVLTQPSQYGRFAWTGVVWPDRAKYECEAHAVERAYRIAREVLSGQHSELYGNGYIWQAEFIQGVDNIYHCGHYYGR